MSRPCHFFSQPGGCRRGDSCTFSHDTVRTTAFSPRRGATRGHNLSSRGTWRRPTSPTSPTTTPDGVCRFFWETGSCNREFSCRFRHQQRDNQPQQEERSAVFAGIGRFTESRVTDLSPAEVHNRLKRFLFDHFRFNGTAREAVFFLDLLANAKPGEKWDREDGQMLLKELGTVGKNGILRLQELLNWADVVTSPSSSVSLLALPFQTSYMKLLSYLTSEFVVKSTLDHVVNALYGLVNGNVEGIINILSTSTASIMERRTFRFKPSDDRVLSGVDFFRTLSTLLFEYLTRFKNAVSSHPEMVAFADSLVLWFGVWRTEMLSSSTTFDDPSTLALATDQREFEMRRLSTDLERVLKIVDRSRHPKELKAKRIGQPDANNGLIAALQTVFDNDGPGALRTQGARNDNDHVYIEEISIVPTPQELLCTIPPYLPANLYNAPHLHAASSMERLLDIQFRLLREELIAPLREAVQLVVDDMKPANRAKKTILAQLDQSGGGRYRAPNDHQHSTTFNIYTNVRFGGMQFSKRGSATPLHVDSPPGNARRASAAARAAFWDGGKGGKRLMQGGLIAVLWADARGELRIYLGTVASSMKDIAESSRQDASRITVKVAFFESSAEVRILRNIRTGAGQNDTIYLVESPIMYESIRPFLEALCREPTSVPFSRYLGHPENGTLEHVFALPPQYATAPGFQFDLGCLLPPDTDMQGLFLRVSHPESVQEARDILSERSSLDSSQSNALIDCLCSEVSLVQGPPGTGKTFTGIEIIRVLLANKLGPILLISFTNHALDHLLEAILEITTSIIRLGARSSNEKIAQYSLETYNMVHQKRYSKDLNEEYKRMKLLESQLATLVKTASRSEPIAEDVLDFLQTNFYDHFQFLTSPTLWISDLYNQWRSDSEDFELVQSKHAAEEDRTLWGFWRQGYDLQFLDQVFKPSAASEADSVREVSQSASSNKFAALNSSVPAMSGEEEEDDAEAKSGDDIASRWLFHWPELSPDENLAVEVPVTTNTGDTTSSVEIQFLQQYQILSHPGQRQTRRSLAELTDGDSRDVWSFSLIERQQLARHDLRRKHSEARKRHQSLKDEADLYTLRNAQVIGCTTTGAAKLTNQLKGVAPRALLVEEAGQVLEAHILGSLVPSIEHMILIGDPLQLRPNIANYSLSMDSRIGKELYRLDMSLMERLSSSGLSMARLEVQRRMRPCISSLIRNTLYGDLQDHPVVTYYPSVSGMVKNLYFLSHQYGEDSSEELLSKRNKHEVAIIKDLVLYLLRQGCYSDPGDIVVLCAYLGQLAAVREALAGHVVTIVGERDQTDLADRDMDTLDEPVVGHFQVSRQVLLRTVDAFQGEEGKIVILSLVRNSGDSEIEVGRRAKSIGFLKSPNRTNVAISRAKEGLYILGNADDLKARSGIWSDIVSELEATDAIGESLAIQCQRHSQEIKFISKPGELPLLSPDGGCLKPCAFRLRCGHACPYKCHADDENHVTVRCYEPCTKLCGLDHPCDKVCWEACGDCRFPYPVVQLPCGHSATSVPCYLVKVPETIKCKEIVEIGLPSCQHKAHIRCGTAPSDHRCERPCGLPMMCCGRSCNAKCSECRHTQGESYEVRHRQHPCEKRLFCGHKCGIPCAVDHTCASFCKAPCLQSCGHTQCRKQCSDACAPCQKKCEWSCQHMKCPSPCGSPCARLPCDKRCPTILVCGHRCPSVCGEDCSIQTCRLCLEDSSDQLDQIVDLVIHRPLRDIATDTEDLDELLITIPSCRHVFTAETLDGTCGLATFYNQDDSTGKWKGLADPPPGFVNHPTCPTCRSRITCPRYGRVYKRADLDLIERNVASRATHSLDLGRTALLNHADAAAEPGDLVRESDFKPPSLSAKDFRRLNGVYSKELEAQARKPLERKFLAINQQKAVSLKEVNDWKTWMDWQSLSRAYGLAYDVATMRTPHVQAWESNQSRYYREVLEELRKDPAKTPRRPEEHAMRLTKIQFAGPPPLADKRYVVEAFWLTIEVRHLVVSASEKWLEALSSLPKSSEQHCHVWAAFIHFLLASCERDARTAQGIAQGSKSRRQSVRSLVYINMAQFELCRFNVHMSRKKPLSADARDLLAGDAQKQMGNTKEAVIAEQDAFRSTALQAGDQAWLDVNLVVPTRKLMEEWEALIRSIRMDVFYTRVSEDDLREVVRAFQSEFTHVGHFYQCPNGHIYVIGDCGGAVVGARCHECGAPIGGSNHTITSGNTRATEMESLLQAGGAGQSPWAWGRN